MESTYSFKLITVPIKTGSFAALSIFAYTKGLSSFTVLLSISTDPQFISTLVTAPAFVPIN